MQECSRTPNEVLCLGTRSGSSEFCLHPLPRHWADLKAWNNLLFLGKHKFLGAVHGHSRPHQPPQHRDEPQFPGPGLGRMKLGLIVEDGQGRHRALGRPGPSAHAKAPSETDNIPRWHPWFHSDGFTGWDIKAESD